MKAAEDPGLTAFLPGGNSYEETLVRVQAARGQRYEVHVKLIAIGPAPVTVTLRPAELPQGVSATGATVSLAAGGTAHTTVTLQLSHTTPIAPDQPITFDVIARVVSPTSQSQGLAGTLTLSLSVYEPFYQVSVVGEPRDEPNMEFKSVLSVWRDGAWTMTVSVNNQDDHDMDAIVATLYLDAGGQEYRVFHAFAVGGRITGPPSQSRAILSGNNPWLGNAFVSVVTGAYPYRLCLRRDVPCAVVAGQGWRNL